MDCSYLYLSFSSFQHAVVRNMSDKNAQMQKQLDNVVREGMENMMIIMAMELINFKSSKWGNQLIKLQDIRLVSLFSCAISRAIIHVPELERDLELERRKNRELQEASRERDKEYQKLKACTFICLLTISCSHATFLSGSE